MFLTHLNAISDSLYDKFRKKSSCPFISIGVIHLVRTQNFSKNLRVRIMGKKCYFFEKFCGRTKWMTPSAVNC